MNKAPRSFCSKVLLFGEYSIIRNSMALAIPYPLFDGHLTFAEKLPVDRENHPGHFELLAFAQYIAEVTAEKASELPLQFNLSALNEDLEKGLIFKSSIPQGHGVGSSGALCAALFARYGQWKNSSGHSLDISVCQEGDYSALREVFSLLESHFHGKSSGIDPMISYLNGPLLINSQREIKKVEVPAWDRPQKGAWLFLIDTGIRRKTEALVNLFLEKCEQTQFSKLCQEELIPVTNRCIDSFLKGNLDKLQRDFKVLSQFQYHHFRPMIPPPFHSLWREGLEKGPFLLKLCGAGGGGFILGLTFDLEAAKKVLCHYPLRPLYGNQ